MGEQMEKKKYLKAMGKNTEEMGAEELETIDTVKLMKEHADAANKKKEEAERKLREAVKKLDYMVRAVRIEEMPLVKKKFEEKVQKDRERYENETVVKAKRAKAQWELDVKEKDALQEFVIYDFYSEFEKKGMAPREILHTIACQEAERIAEMEADERKRKRAIRRKEEAARAKEEEAARLKAEEEKRKMEEEKARQAELARSEELQKKERDKHSSDRALPSSRDLDAAASNGRYVPPSRRTRGGDRSFSDRGGDRGGDRGFGDRGRFGNSGSSRYDDTRGGGYGGGRYSGAKDRDRDGGGGYGRDRDRRSGDRSEPMRNNRWN